MSCFSSANSCSIFYNNCPEITEIIKHHKSSDSHLKGGQPGMNPNTSTWWEEQAGSLLWGALIKKKKSLNVSTEIHILLLGIALHVSIDLHEKIFFSALHFQSESRVCYSRSKEIKVRILSPGIHTASNTINKSFDFLRVQKSSKEHFCWGKLAVEGFQVLLQPVFFSFILCVCIFHQVLLSF